LNCIETERQGKTAIVRFSREKSYNAMNGELITEFAQTVGLIEESDARTVILTGKGKAFSAGGDVTSMRNVAQSDRGEFFNILTTPLHEAIAGIVKSEKIWIAAVNGIAAGAGVSTALACDITVASKDTKFILSYEKIGLSPDGGATFFLNQLLGFKKAIEIIIMDPAIDAEEALRLNIINQCFEPEHLIEEALKIAKQINEKSFDAVSASKKLVRAPYFEALKAQLDREAKSIAKMAQTQNAEIGINAFMEKRPPKFR